MKDKLHARRDDIPKRKDADEETEARGERHVGEPSMPAGEHSEVTGEKQGSDVDRLLEYLDSHLGDRIDAAIRKHLDSKSDEGKGEPEDEEQKRECSCPRINGQAAVVIDGPRPRPGQARRFASPRCARLAGLTRPHPWTLCCDALDAERRPHDRSCKLHQHSELARRAVVQRLVRMNGIVVLKPTIEPCQHRCSVGSRVNARIVAFESLHESLGHAVRLRALDWRGSR